MSNQYPKDEFDRSGEDMPVGMHRPQPSKWKSVLPFLLILVLAIVFGWGASHFLTSRGVITPESGDATTSQSGPAQSGGASGEPTTEPAQSGEESAEPQETESAEPTPSESESTVPEIDHGVKIAVLNGTSTQGYAAQQAALLNQAGFAGTTAGNATGWATSVATVYYADPDLQPSAEEIARVLGISTVQTTERTNLSGSDVVVILR
ncbi:MAG: LytR C-terminal domain-containing protein [Pauljensenia sp.]